MPRKKTFLYSESETEKHLAPEFVDIHCGGKEKLAGSRICDGN